jgi:nucleoside-diphosphate-sugar epimerase
MYGKKTKKPFQIKMNKKHKFLITGGLGYIGSAFAKKALSLGHEIVLYDSAIYEQDIEGILKRITGLKNLNEKMTLVIGDTRNTKLLQDTIDKHSPTFVLHLAELSSVYACNHNPKYTKDINFLASKKALEIFEKNQLPVIYNSTSSLYGNQPKIKEMTENDPLPKPTDLYCEYKLKMEKAIQKMVEKNPNFKIIVFRPATVFGIAPRMRLELLPNHFTYLAVAQRRIRISELNAYRAAIDINDLIDAYFKTIEKKDWQSLIYNIGHLNMSKKEFALGIKKISNCILSTMTDIGDLRNLQIDSTKFSKEFGFKAKTPYSKTIKEVVFWVRKNLNTIEKNNFAGIINMSLAKWLEII